MLGLATIDLCTKREISMFTHYRVRRYEMRQNMQKLGWFGG